LQNNNIIPTSERFHSEKLVIYIEYTSIVVCKTIVVPFIPMVNQFVLKTK